AVKHAVLETLNSFTLKEFKKFKWLLQSRYFQKGLPQIPQSRLERADRAEMVEMVDLMVESLQSEAGRFECSVSALRWVCKETVSLEYQFVSWEGHMERMKSMQYKPAGPLMNITVNAGKLDEVYLPHWICIDVVEKVSEVTSSHVKLSEPVFSPRAALVKAGFPVKTKSYVLIYYKPNTPVLKLHVYVIPKDPALQKVIENLTTEISDRYEKIRKPHPDKYLKMKQGFILTADINTADISPEVQFILSWWLRRVRYWRITAVAVWPHRTLGFSFLFKIYQLIVLKLEIGFSSFFFSFFFYMQLPPMMSLKPNHLQFFCFVDNLIVVYEHFVDKHQLRLIKRVTNIASILDELLDKKVINNEKWEEIRKMPTPDAKMREVYICMRAGDECKNIFFEILKRQEKLLIEDLQKKN
uniref:CARD domain-containing protein n=1 Tax=Seriola lalandi dorsalis TaxID=1841481 RepID=A0A3B4X275_SERLL